MAPEAPPLLTASPLTVMLAVPAATVGVTVMLATPVAMEAA